jgi:cohesin complex subunit SA-1/2
MLHMHLLFRATADVLTPVEKKITAWPVPESLVLQLDDQAQRRCAGFIQAEIERHLEDRSNLARAASQENELDEEDTLSDGEDGPKKRRGKKSDAAQMNEGKQNWPELTERRTRG